MQRISISLLTGLFSFITLIFCVHPKQRLQQGGGDVAVIAPWTMYQIYFSMMVYPLQYFGGFNVILMA